MTTTYDKGLYQAEIVAQGFEESAAKGTPGFYLQLRILGRYDANGALQDCPRYERTIQQWLANEVGVNILLGALKALDVQVANLTQLDPGSAHHVNLVGRKIDVACELETYLGRQVERWSLPRSKKKKLALDKVRDLDDKFGHLLRDNGLAAKPTLDPVVPNTTDTPF